MCRSVPNARTPPIFPCCSFNLSQTPLFNFLGSQYLLFELQVIKNRTIYQPTIVLIYDLLIIAIKQMKSVKKTEKDNEGEKK